MNHEKLLFYIISLFLFWVFWSWFVFLNSLSVFYFFVRVSALRSLFLFWDLYFCFLEVFFCFGFAVSCFCFDVTLRKRNSLCIGFSFIICSKWSNKLPCKVGIHFYAWCTKNRTRKEIRSLHNTENSYCTTLKRIMYNITCNNIITCNFQGAVKPL